MNILLLATNLYIPLYLMQCLNTLDVNVYVAGFGKMPPIRLSRYSRGYLMIEKEDFSYQTPKLISQINNYCQDKQIDIILPSGMESFLFVSKVKKRLRTPLFPIADINTLKLLDNKFKFGLFLERNSLPYPTTCLLKYKAELPKLNLKFPLIVKPINMHSGLGIVKVNSIKELEEYLSIKNQYNKLPLLLQEYITGPSLDVSFFAKNGKIIAWTMQKTQNDGSLKFINDQKILKMVEKIIKLSEYSGVGHIDMIYEEKSKSVKILEFNPRFWGSIYASKLAGINFAQIGLQVALDFPITKFKYKEYSYITAKNYLKKIFSGRMTLHKMKRLNDSDILEMLKDPFVYQLLLINELQAKFKNLETKESIKRYYNKAQYFFNIYTTVVNNKNPQFLKFGEAN